MFQGIIIRMEVNNGEHYDMNLTHSYVHSEFYGTPFVNAYLATDEFKSIYGGGGGAYIYSTDTVVFMYTCKYITKSPHI